MRKTQVNFASNAKGERSGLPAISATNFASGTLITELHPVNAIVAFPNAVRNRVGKLSPLFVDYIDG